MVRKFVPITAQELKDRIKDAYHRHPDYLVYKQTWDELMEDGILSHLTKQIRKDLDKIDFDTENISALDQHGTGTAPVGFEKLDNGLTFLGVTAGGDWEFPIFYIIYWDGTALRAYIPNKGNVYNRKTKSAYGNDDKFDGAEDEASHYNNEDFDYSELVKDIKGRIVRR